MILELYIMGYDRIPIKCTLTFARKLGKILLRKILWLKTKIYRTTNEENIKI
jgi:hypothetical protein